MKLRMNNSVPKFGLMNLLKRRKSTLKLFLSEFGITTYAGLCEMCQKIGVAPPTEQIFNNSLSVDKMNVNNPSEGVVVIQIEPEQISDNIVQYDEQIHAEFEQITSFDDIQRPQKKSKKQKDIGQ